MRDRQRLTLVVVLGINAQHEVQRPACGQILSDGRKRLAELRHQARKSVEIIAVRWMLSLEWVCSVSAGSFRRRVLFSLKCCRAG